MGNTGWKNALGFQCQIREKYSNKDFIKELLDSFEKYKNKEKDRYNIINEYFNVLY